MRVVGFEADGGLRLGIVEGDQVIDLQGVDPKVPANLGDALAANNGDLKALADIAKRAPASARRPLKGLKFGLPVARPGKILCLGLNYLEHVKEGSQRDNIPKFPTIFFRMLTSVAPHLAPLIRPRVSETFDYEAEMVLIIGKRAKHMTLEPGDIIFTGTPSGVGHARKPNPVWMKQGDVCEIEIEGIGILRNPIQNEA